MKTGDPMLLALLPAQHPMLRLEALPCEADEFTRDLAKRMLHAMYATHNAVGLAAPQVGYSMQLFVMDSSIGRNEPRVFLNPKIIGGGGEPVLATEGCLSLPCSYLTVARWPRIEMEWSSIETGTLNYAVFTGLEARIVQHEVDHLRGVLITDREYHDEG